MSEAVNIAQIRSLPKLHLFDYLISDGASTYANFVHAIYDEGSCFTLPKQIKMRSYGEHQFVIAEGCYLRLKTPDQEVVPNDYEGYDGLVEWLITVTKEQIDRIIKELRSQRLVSKVVGWRQIETIDSGFEGAVKSIEE